MFHTTVLSHFQNWYYFYVVTLHYILRCKTEDQKKIRTEEIQKYIIPASSHQPPQQEISPTIIDSVLFIIIIIIIAVIIYYILLLQC